MLLHDETQVVLALERIEEELKDAHLYARLYGKGWDRVEELQKLYDEYHQALQSHNRELVAASAR